MNKEERALELAIDFVTKQENHYTHDEIVALARKFLKFLYGSNPGE